MLARLPYHTSDVGSHMLAPHIAASWLQVLHTFVKEVSGHTLDFTAPVAKLLHTLT